MSNPTRIRVKGGLMWDVSQRWGCSVEIRGTKEIRSTSVLALYHADQIAYKNGLVCAERFTKKYEGQTVSLDYETLKVIEESKDAESK